VRDAPTGKTRSGRDPVEQSLPGLVLMLFGQRDQVENGDAIRPCEQVEPARKLEAEVRWNLVRVRDGEPRLPRRLQERQTMMDLHANLLPVIYPHIGEHV